MSTERYIPESAVRELRDDLNANTHNAGNEALVRWLDEILATAAPQKDTPEPRRFREAAIALQESLSDLIQQSEGVAGLHLNGDVAPWEELMAGGRYEEWLRAYDDFGLAIAAAQHKDAELDEFMDDDDERAAFPHLRDASEPGECRQCGGLGLTYSRDEMATPSVCPRCDQRGIEPAPEPEGLREALEGMHCDRNAWESAHDSSPCTCGACTLHRLLVAAALQEDRDEKIEELRAALEPFAHPVFREKWSGASTVYARNDAALTVGDFERAAHALKPSARPTTDAPRSEQG